MKYNLQCLAYIYNNVDAEICHIDNGLFIIDRYLGMMNQTIKILISDAVFADDI